jgi:uncharacterized protein YcbX
MQHIVKELWIYPIKSLGGIKLEKAHAETEGLQHDRRWMLVDENGKFITQREHHNLATYTCRIDNEAITVTHKNDSISIPIEGQSDNIVKVSVWSSELKANEVDPLISEWFSDHLSMNATLIRMTDISHRPKRLTVPPFNTDLSLADGYPYLILGEESMRHLNAKLQTPISANRFRANVIVSSEIAHEEDQWNSISVGSSTLQIIKPCARCVVVTIDQATGIAGQEPTKTLATYRRDENKILFGANAICTHPGIISVGDALGKV